MRLHPALVILALATPCALAPRLALADAQADGADPTAQLKADGDRAMAEHRYLDALGLYDRAYAASRSAAVLFNRGRALEALGRYPEALDTFERFDREAAKDVRARVPKLDEILATTRARVTTLTVLVRPDGARVLLDGVQLGLAPLAPARVNAGRATLEISADGHDTERREITLDGGARTALEVTLRRREAARAVNPVVPTPGNPADAGTTGPMTSRWWFWAGVGIVVVSGVVTVVALTTEKSPEPGSYPPGVLRAPAVRF